MLIAAALCLSFGLTAAVAEENGTAKPDLLLKEIVEGMPAGAKQEIKVLTATFKPGDKTVYHTHAFPVIVYVIDGTFTLELDGQEPIVVKAGQALVEPPRVAMTGYNRSSTEGLEVLIVYVSEPGAPFLHPKHGSPG